MYLTLTCWRVFVWWEQHDPFSHSPASCCQLSHIQPSSSSSSSSDVPAPPLLLLLLDLDLFYLSICLRRKKQYKRRLVGLFVVVVWAGDAERRAELWWVWRPVFTSRAVNQPSDVTRRLPVWCFTIKASFVSMGTGDYVCKWCLRSWFTNLDQRRLDYTWGLWVVWNFSVVNQTSFS